MIHTVTEAAKFYTMQEESASWSPSGADVAQSKDRKMKTLKELVCPFEINGKRKLTSQYSGGQKERIPFLLGEQ